MAEPTTALTDFLMAAVAFVLAARCIGAWRYAFLFSAIAALSGGMYHSTPSAFVWKVTAFAAGLATFFMIAGGSAATLTRRSGRILTVVAGVQLAVYIGWMAMHNDFIYVVADYGSGMLCVAVLYAIAWRRMPRAAAFVLVSIAVAALGAYVQAAHVSLHPRFNHNDLYHVIQTGSLLLLYRGVSLGAARIRS